MKAFIFLRPSSPSFMGQEFGHVGWGFKISPTEYIIGAVENSAGTPISAPGKMDFWFKRTTEPCSLFSLGPIGINSRYDVYKELSVPKFNVEAALNKMDWVSKQSYNVACQNCMHSTYDILFSFGATNLPNPFEVENIAPVLWFQKIGVSPKVLIYSDLIIDVALYEQPQMLGNVKRFFGTKEIAIPDVTKKQIGFTISSLVVKKGTITIYSEKNFMGESMKLDSGNYREFLDEWDNRIASIELGFDPSAVFLKSDATKEILNHQFQLESDLEIINF